jgi:hypothetical protein
MLVDHSRKHSLPLWSELGAKLQSVVSLKSDNVNAGLRLLPAGFDNIASGNFNFLILLGELAEALSHTGRTAEALRLIDQGIDLSEEDWLTPELFRLKGELLLAQITPGAVETAEHLFRQAQDGARRQEVRALVVSAGSFRCRGNSPAASL